MNERNGSNRCGPQYSSAPPHCRRYFAPGCEKGESDSAHQAKAPAPPATLRLAVVDDPALAESLRKVRGEWRAQSGSELEVQELATSAVVDAKKLDADAIVYPSGFIRPAGRAAIDSPVESELAGRRSVGSRRPVDRSPIRLNFPGMANRTQFRWANRCSFLAYRSDLFERFGKQPPRTWEEYQSLAEFFGDRAKLLAAAKQGGAKEQPLGIARRLVGHAGAAGLEIGLRRILLARAAAYAKHRDYFSVLFDRETMKPLIAGPPFVKALTELAAASKSSHADFNKLTPPDTINLLLSGNAAMAIGWPKAAAQPSNDQAAKMLGAAAAAFAELPGAWAAYNPGHQAWEDRGAMNSNK